jgi:hypothetical protein
MSMFDQNFDAVALAVWQRWTNNVDGLSDDMLEQTRKSVDDAVNNAWQEGWEQEEEPWNAAALRQWQADALRALGHGSP